MNRIQKRFLSKIGKFVGFFVGSSIYLILAIFVPEYIFQTLLGFESGLGAFIGMMIFIVLPILGIIIRDVYQDAKLEVESENRQMMRELGK